MIDATKEIVIAMLNNKYISCSSNEQALKNVQDAIKKIYKTLNEVKHSNKSENNDQKLD